MIGSYVDGLTGELVNAEVERPERFQVAELGGNCACARGSREKKGGRRKDDE